MSRRVSPLTIATLIVAAVLVGIGVIYLSYQCQHIPAPLPGREAGSTDHRVGFAAGAFLLGAVALLGAYLTSRRRAD